MTGLLFADTNLVVYSLDPVDPGKRAKAKLIISAGAAVGRLVTSPQTLNEAYRVLCHRRRLMPAVEARKFVATLFPTCRAELSLATTMLAWEIEAETAFAWWDCLLLASAIDHGCDYFLTEDLSDRQSVRGMTLLNPFTNDVTPLLA